MEDLRNYWDGATCFAEGIVSEKWWNIIVNHYTSEGRVFHNISYLQNMLKLYQQFSEKLNNPQAVVLAIFFHKVEYNPRNSEMDAENVVQFDAFINEAGESFQTSEIATYARSYLEAAITNLTDANMTPGGHGSEDVHYFLDLTMSMLGSMPNEYDQYVQKIQAEYSHIITSTYVQLRLKTLKSLLMIPNIYATQDFQTIYEKNARENIQREIETTLNV